MPWSQRTLLLFGFGDPSSSLTSCASISSHAFASISFLRSRCSRGVRAEPRYARAASTDMGASVSGTSMAALKARSTRVLATAPSVTAAFKRPLSFTEARRSCKLYVIDAFSSHMDTRGDLAWAATLGVTLLSYGCASQVPPLAEPTEARPSRTEPLSVEPPPVAPRLDALPSDAPVCAGVLLEGAVTVIGENRSVSLSGAQATAGPIVARWVLQDSGSSEHVSSAHLATKAGDPGTTVRVGDLVPIGTGRYCVVDIVYHGGSEPSVSLQKVAR